MSLGSVVHNLEAERPFQNRSNRRILAASWQFILHFSTGLENL